VNRGFFYFKKHFILFIFIILLSLLMVTGFSLFYRDSPLYLY